MNIGEDRKLFLGLHAVNIFVRDQEESLRFYLDTLGFDVAFDARLHTGERWVAVAPPDGTAVLALVAPRLESREYRLIGRPTGIVFVTEDVIAKYEEWRKRGVRFLFTPRLRRFQYQAGAKGVRAAEGNAEPGARSEIVAVGEAPGVQTAEEQRPVWGGVFTRFADRDGNSFGLVGFDEVNRQIEARRRQVEEKVEAERRLAQELEIARQVQERLFPQSLPLLESLEYAGACVPARQVGGDYHDFLELGGGRFGLVIADIAGKGIAAALLMANLQANLRSQCTEAWDEPGRLLRSVNRLFYENTGDSAYATLFLADYDDRSRRLRYVNCGHLAALLLRRGGDIQRLESTATVVGLFARWDCAVEECRLGHGDTLVLYTDGITESRNLEEEEYGEQRLIEAVSRRQQLCPAAMVPEVIGDVQRFSPREQQDDITLVVARCRECDGG